MNPHQQEAERLEVKVEDGKYTVIQESNGNFYALRYDQPWRTLVGDNLVLALAQDLLTARDELVEWKKAAFACGLYRADTAHETPALWEKAQTDAAIALLNARDERNEYRSLLYGCDEHRLWKGDECIGCMEAERNKLRAELWLKDEMLSKRIIDMDLVMENTNLKAKLEQRDKAIIDSANAADASEQSRNKAIAKVEELRAELERVKAESDKVKFHLGTANSQIDALSNLISNAADTLRSRGYVAPKPFDERVIAMAQDNDSLRSQLSALMGVARAAKAVAEIIHTSDELENSLTALREKFPDLLK